MKKITLLITILLVILGVSFSQAAQFKPDFGHSEIRFKSGHIFSTVSGLFSDYTATIAFDPEKLNEAVFDFTIKVKSINTMHPKRDNHLRSDEFFHADKYPDMRFKSSRVFHIKENLYGIEGVLTIKDVSKSISVEFSYFAPTDNPFDKKTQVAGFNTSFSLNRLDYGVGSGIYAKKGVIKNKVVVEISMEALTDR